MSDDHPCSPANEGGEGAQAPSFFIWSSSPRGRADAPLREDRGHPPRLANHCSRGTPDATFLPTVGPLIFCDATSPDIEAALKPANGGKMSEYPGLPHEGQDPSPHMSGQLPPTTLPRGQKRSLTAAFSSGSGTLRTAVACRSCRERKTRCSGHQPRCNYCSRAGVPCEYLPGVVSAPSGPPPT
jgi:hypothetical protein